MKVFEAASEGECGVTGLLIDLGLTIESMDDAEEISIAAYQNMTAAEKAALHREAGYKLIILYNTAPHIAHYWHGHDKEIEQ